MTIPVDENVLLGAAGVIFVPLFVFLIKLIMQVGKMETKIDVMSAQSENHKGSMDILADIQSNQRIMTMRLDNIEKELERARSRRGGGGGGRGDDDQDRRRGSS